MVISSAHGSTQVLVGIARIQELHSATQEVGPITAGARERAVSGFRDVEWSSRLKHGHATDLPPTKNLSGKAFLILVERELVDVAQHVAVTDILLAVSTVCARIIKPRV